MQEKEIGLGEAIILKTLMDGSFQGATLTVKGFVGANIMAVRVYLENSDEPITEEDKKELVKFLKDAETALSMLNDPEDKDDE